MHNVRLLSAALAMQCSRYRNGMYCSTYNALLYVFLLLFRFSDPTSVCERVATFVANQLSASSCYHPTRQIKSRQVTGNTSLCFSTKNAFVCTFCLSSFVCLFVRVRNPLVWFDRYRIRRDSSYRSVAVTGCGPLFESRTQFLGCDDRLATLVQFVQ